MKLIHCSYHKCMTVYYKRILSKLYNRMFRFSGGYKHFKSLLDEFYQESEQYKVASVNNHALDLNRLNEDFRISRFVRDPRDLVVSGYYYHKRGAEGWSNIVNPTADDWKVVNGCIPPEMGERDSFSSFLQGLNKEDGLIAEIDFRENHLNSMGEWPTSDERIKVYRYEDLINNEKEVFRDIFEHYELPWLEKRLGLRLAEKYSAKKSLGKKKHIRNVTPSQWKEHFTPKVQDYFEKKHGGLLERYGY